jgi:hypothetical protein
MSTITRNSLMPLEEYAVKRKDFRTRVMAHKHNRKVHLGEHITLLFEDELTIRYQIQEMLRAERIFEEAGIVEELEAYNPLIPDGSNWKVTMLIEYPDESERKQALSRLINVEDRVWIQVADQSRVFAIAAPFRAGCRYERGPKAGPGAGNGDRSPELQCFAGKGGRGGQTIPDERFGALAPGGMSKRAGPT